MLSMHFFAAPKAVTWYTIDTILSIAEYCLRPYLPGDLDTLDFTLGNDNSYHAQPQVEMVKATRKAHRHRSLSSAPSLGWNITPSSMSSSINKQTPSIRQYARRPRSVSAAASLSWTVGASSSASTDAPTALSEPQVPIKPAAVYSAPSPRRGRSVSSAASLGWTVHLRPSMDNDDHQEPIANIHQSPRRARSASSAAALGWTRNLRSIIDTKEDGAKDELPIEASSSIPRPPSPTASEDSGYHSSCSSCSDDEDEDITDTEAQQLATSAPVFVPFPFKSSLSPTAPIFVPLPAAAKSSLSALAPVFVPADSAFTSDDNEDDEDEDKDAPIFVDLASFRRPLPPRRVPFSAPEDKFRDSSLALRYTAMRNSSSQQQLPAFVTATGQKVDLMKFSSLPSRQVFAELA